MADAPTPAEFVEQLNAVIEECEGGGFAVLSYLIGHMATDLAPWHRAELLSVARGYAAECGLPTTHLQNG